MEAGVLNQASHFGVGLDVGLWLIATERNLRTYAETYKILGKSWQWCRRKWKIVGASPQPHLSMLLDLPGSGYFRIKSRPFKDGDGSLSLVYLHGWCFLLYFKLAEWIRG